MQHWNWVNHAKTGPSSFEVSLVPLQPHMSINRLCCLCRMTSQLLATYEADIDRAVNEAQVQCLDLIGHQVRNF
jgi:hypothetical protein